MTQGTGRLRVAVVGIELQKQRAFELPCNIKVDLHQDILGATNNIIWVACNGVAMYSARLTPSMASALTNYALPWIHRKTWDQDPQKDLGPGPPHARLGVDLGNRHFTQGPTFYPGAAFHPRGCIYSIPGAPPMRSTKQGGRITAAPTRDVELQRCRDAATRIAYRSRNAELNCVG